MKYAVQYGVRKTQHGARAARTVPRIVRVARMGPACIINPCIHSLRSNPKYRIRVKAYHGEFRVTLVNAHLSDHNAASLAVSVS